VALVAEPTRICRRCDKRKPWSEFYAKRRWPDGTTRNPHSYCIACWPAVQRENYARSAERRARRREYNRRYQEAVQADPERLALHNEGRRFRYRELNGVTRRARVVGRSRHLPAAPFAEWLRSLGLPLAEIERWLGLDGSHARRLLRGEQASVDLDVVDRACLAFGVSIDAIYGEDA